MHRRHASATVLSATLLALWAALTWATAPGESTAPDPASARAVRALVAQSPQEAAESVPAGFAYTPQVEDGSLVNPTGSCSSPVPLPADFDTACRSHDLGYDLIRHADRAGGTLPPSARQALDERLGEQLQSTCDAREPVGTRVWCRTWADIAGGAVRINSRRQHDLVPSAEDPGTLATGTVGVLALGSGCGSALLGLRRAQARLRGRARRREVAERAPLPRVSTAVAATLGGALSISPASLPHGWLLQGALTTVLICAALGAATIVRPRAARLVGRSRAWGIGVAAVACAGVLVWAQEALSTRRAEIGLDTIGPGYWCGVAAVVVATLVLARGARGVWRQRARVWRPEVAVVASGAVLAGASPVHAAGTTVAEAEVLVQPSPTGAVRAYAGIRDGEDLDARARRVADDLERRGGLRRSHVVIAVPTGSGWVNPNLVSGLERRFGRDVATVGMQYDSSPSWWAYLAHREQAQQGARAVVEEVLTRVRAVPADRRPQVHVAGESLGAAAGQAVFTSEVLGDVCSALWVGSPGGHVAGLPREASVANADDPVVHASLRGLVVPDDEGGRWLPFVSAAHDAADFLGSLEVPDGSGHKYGPDIADALPTCS